MYAFRVNCFCLSNCHLKVSFHSEGDRINSTVILALFLPTDLLVVSCLEQGELHSVDPGVLAIRLIAHQTLGTQVHLLQTAAGQSWLTSLHASIICSQSSDILATVGQFWLHSTTVYSIQYCACILCNTQLCFLLFCALKNKLAMKFSQPKLGIQYVMPCVSWWRY